MPIKGDNDLDEEIADIILRLEDLDSAHQDRRLKTAIQALCAESAVPTNRPVRNSRIQQIANQFFANEPPGRQANELARRMRYYATRGGWKRHQHKGRCPSRLEGTIDGAIWALWVDFGHKVFSKRMLERILSR